MTPSDPAPGADDVVLRPAGREDLGAVADLHLRTRAAAVPAMPPVVHDAAAVRAHIGGWDLSRRELWLAESAEALLGYAVLRGDWLHSLYVDPGWQRGGVGTALLALAQALRPGGFCLWVFASNTPARAFYARHGLIELETTDGAGNDEGAPDVRTAWPGGDPLAFLRTLIDEVDDGLGDLLARRVALTRQVQRHKRAATDGAPPARDPEREREVARRLAGRAPELGEERLARLVDLLVTESLAALRQGAGQGPGEGSRA